MVYACQLPVLAMNVETTLPARKYGQGRCLNVQNVAKRIQSQVKVTRQ